MMNKQIAYIILITIVIGFCLVGCGGGGGSSVVPNIPTENPTAPPTPVEPGGKLSGLVLENDTTTKITGAYIRFDSYVKANGLTTSAVFSAETNSDPNAYYEFSSLAQGKGYVKFWRSEMDYTHNLAPLGARNVQITDQPVTLNLIVGLTDPNSNTPTPTVPPGSTPTPTSPPGSTPTPTPNDPNTTPTIPPTPTNTPTTPDPTPEAGKGLVIVQMPMAAGGLAASDVTSYTATKLENIFTVSLLSSINDVNLYKNDYITTQSTINNDGKAFFQLDPGNYNFSTFYGSDCIVGNLDVMAGQTTYLWADVYNYITLNLVIKPKWPTTFDNIQNFERYFVKLYDPVAQRTIVVPLLRQDNYDNKKWLITCKVPKAEYIATAYMLDKLGNKLNTDLTADWYMTYGNIQNFNLEIYDYELSYTYPENLNSTNVKHWGGVETTLWGENVWGLLVPDAGKVCIWDSYQNDIPYWYSSLATGYWANKQTTVYTDTTDDSIIMTSEVLEKTGSSWSYRDIRGKDFTGNSKQIIPILFLSESGKEYRFRDFVLAGRVNVGIQSKNIGKVVNIKVQQY